MITHYSRREFLYSCAAAGSFHALPRHGVTVGVTPTVFFGNPRGDTNLVRFTANNIDAPAGRLRVFDTQRRLLGTAGMIGIEGTLYGELWLRIGEQARINLELETPASRNPVRTAHVIHRPRRWTLHWITVVDPQTLIDRLEAMNQWERAAAISLMNQTAVMGNPYASAPGATRGIDHLEYLQSGKNAAELETRFAVPASNIAIADSSDLRMNAAPLALAGSGIRYALLLDDDHHSFFQYTGRDGSRVTTASPPPGGTPTQLGFADGHDEMSSAVEKWLTTSPGLHEARYSPDAILVVSTDLESDRALMLTTLADWQQRYAFPRIVLGGADEFFARIASLSTPRELFSVTNPMPHRSEPPMETLVEASDQRARAAVTRVRNLIAPLNRLLGVEGSNVTDFASVLDFGFDGSLVFNPSPLARTDVVHMPDGSERIITMVPGLGYVFIPDAAPGPPEHVLEHGGAEITGQRFTVSINGETGAIQSMYQRDVSRGWSDVARGGLNEVPTARLASLRRYRMPDVGTRVIAVRPTLWGVLTSVYTVYDYMPWVDIENTVDHSGSTPIRYRFSFDVDARAVAWETAAGYEEQSPPTTNFAHLRWITMRSSDRWAALLRCLDHPFARITCDSPDSPHQTTIVSITPGGRSRYRIDTMRPWDNADHPWHFGWNGEPFVVTRVPRAGARDTRATRGAGSRQIGTFGQILTIDPGVMVLTVKEADDGFGIIVYLQEVAGLTRSVTVRPDLIRFKSAHLVDLIERDRGEPLAVSDDVVSVPLRGFGITAIRLSQLSLRAA